MFSRLRQNVYTVLQCLQMSTQTAVLIKMHECYFNGNEFEFDDDNDNKLILKIKYENNQKIRNYILCLTFSAIPRNVIIACFVLRM